MKSAYGWLAAAVLAAGLNASYHDGGFEWAHRVADRVMYSSGAVLALASGRADQFLADAQLLTARQETASCRFATALARVQTTMVRHEAGFDRFHAMSAREEAQLARLEANRARIETQVAVQTARLGVAMRINPASFNSASFNPPAAICPRVRVNVPRVPLVRIPAPVIHVETVGADPI